MTLLREMRAVGNNVLKIRFDHKSRTELNVTDLGATEGVDATGTRSNRFCFLVEGKDAGGIFGFARTVSTFAPY